MKVKYKCKEKNTLTFWLIVLQNQSIAESIINLVEWNSALLQVDCERDFHTPKWIICDSIRGFVIKSKKKTTTAFCHYGAYIFNVRQKLSVCEHIADRAHTTTTRPPPPPPPTTTTYDNHHPLPVPTNEFRSHGPILC